MDHVGIIGGGVRLSVQGVLGGQHRQGQHGAGLDVLRLGRKQKHGLRKEAPQQEAAVPQGPGLRDAADAEQALVPEHQGPGLALSVHPENPLRQDLEEGAFPIAGADKAPVPGKEFSKAGIIHVDGAEDASAAALAFLPEIELAVAAPQKISLPFLVGDAAEQRALPVIDTQGVAAFEIELPL